MTGVVRNFESGVPAICTDLAAALRSFLRTSMMNEESTVIPMFLTAAGTSVSSALGCPHGASGRPLPQGDPPTFDRPTLGNPRRTGHALPGRDERRQTSSLPHLLLP